MTDLIDEFGMLPCPFCGGKAYLHKIGNEYTKKRGWDTGCKKCRIHKSDRVIHQDHDWLLPKVINHWNTRTDVPTGIGHGIIGSSWGDEEIDQ